MPAPFSPPDFTGVQPEHFMKVLRLCEQGNGDDVLARFESDFAHLVGSKYAVALSSATTSLHLALIALGVGEDDVVICPTFTFAASAFPILYQKAIPVFVDSEIETWNISPDYLEQAIKQSLSKGKKPKAVIVVHSYGNPAKLDELLSICQQYDIPLIEDAANALGSTFAGKQVGFFGKIGVFSFNRNKIISAAGGGCLVTDDSAIAEKVRYHAHQAKSKTPYYQHELLGYNYGLSPILAEVVRVQLPTLKERVSERQTISLLYKQIITQEASWQKLASNATSNCWLNVLGCHTEELKTEITALAESLQVGMKEVWKPMHLQPVFNNPIYVGNKESEVFFNKGLCLPFSRKIANSYKPVVALERAKL